MIFEYHDTIYDNYIVYKNMIKISLHLIILALIIFVVFQQNDKRTTNDRKRMIYNNSTLFEITNTMPESLTYTFLSPSCMFDGNYTKHDCKSYTSLFLDMNCTLHQNISIVDHKGNPDYHFYLAPSFYYKYDARLNVYNQTNYTQIRLAPGISCQSNNICVYVMNFILAYKDWNKVPIFGNNVTLNCSVFSIYTYT